MIIVLGYRAYQPRFYPLAETEKKKKKLEYAFLSVEEKKEWWQKEQWMKHIFSLSLPLGRADIAVYIVDLQLHWIRRALWTTDATQGSQLM